MTVSPIRATICTTNVLLSAFDTAAVNLPLRMISTFLVVDKAFVAL